MNLFAYKITRDFGFAPNPFFGWCTLATCKPGIRSSAAVGDWIVGTTGNSLNGKRFAGHMLYAMQVSEIMSFTQYWNDIRFLPKRPFLSGSLKQVYGDNVYHKENECFIQEDCHHSFVQGVTNYENYNRDTSVDRVLIATQYAYYGKSALLVPKCYGGDNEFRETINSTGRNFRRSFQPEYIEIFIKWIEELDNWGVIDNPVMFTNHQRNY